MVVLLVVVVVAAVWGRQNPAVEGGMVVGQSLAMVDCEVLWYRLF